MTRELVTETEPITLQQANDKLKLSKKSKLMIVNDRGELCGLISRKDLIKNAEFPDASKDKRTHKLLVGATIGTREDSKLRMAGLNDVGVDVVIIDSAQGDTKWQADMIRYVKSNYPRVDVIGGNVVTQTQAKHLIDAGVDGLRVGMGVGSICMLKFYILYCSDTMHTILY